MARFRSVADSGGARGFKHYHLQRQMSLPNVFSLEFPLEIRLY